MVLSEEKYDATRKMYQNPKCEQKQTNCEQIYKLLIYWQLFHALISEYFGNIRKIFAKYSPNTISSSFPAKFRQVSESI